MKGTSVPSQLACPRCVGALHREGDGIRCEHCGRVGGYHAGVWDFVEGHDYAASFGIQWREFSRTQVDSCNGTTISRDRFELITGWGGADLRGCTVLDAGCGSGRFAEIADAHGGAVTALDLSEAAYAACENLRPSGVTVVRGDLLAPPLRRASFDKVFSIGVLQHTPDAAAVATELVRLLRPGGQICIWMYERRWYTPLMPKALLRILGRRLSPHQVARLTSGLVRSFTPMARAVGSLPASLRRPVRALLPIASYWGQLPLDTSQQREWSLLDTHDWVSPAFDRPLDYETLCQALLRGGAADVGRKDVPGLAVTATRAG